MADGGEKVDLDRLGRKVETGRPVASAAGRGALVLVARRSIVRGHRRLGPGLRMLIREYLWSGVQQTFDKNGVR